MNFSPLSAQTQIPNAANLERKDSPRAREEDDAVAKQRKQIRSQSRVLKISGWGNKFEVGRESRRCQPEANLLSRIPSRTNAKRKAKRKSAPEKT